VQQQDLGEGDQVDRDHGGDEPRWLIANVRLPACPGRSLAAAGRVLDRVLEA